MSGSKNGVRAVLTRIVNQYMNEPKMAMYKPIVSRMINDLDDKAIDGLVDMIKSISTELSDANAADNRS